MLRLTAVLVICAGLAACGMKGPLYLPEGESAATPKTATVSRIPRKPAKASPKTIRKPTTMTWNTAGNPIRGERLVRIYPG